MSDFQKIVTKQQRRVNVIYVSSYIPRKCGIATYTKDLTNAINLLNSRSLAEILTVTHPTEEIDYPWESKFKINTNDLASYLAAAQYANQSHADIVHLQHEFGLYGGDSGEYIIPFIENLTTPLVTTFHTVLTEPNAKQREIIKRIARKSKAIIVMMEQVSGTLTSVYKIPRKKIIVIPHGVPDIAFQQTELHKRKRKLSDKILLGNINLLDHNKGIEYALEAVAIIAKQYPNVLYAIIGQTHPDVLQREGETYRNFLKRKVRELGIEKNVRFVNEYLQFSDLVSWLQAMDIYITPYLDPQQVTSGALAYAIGAGKVCIATPYVYSQEVLAEGRGIIVPFCDPKAIADAVLNTLNHPEKREEMSARAYQYGRLMTWPNVAQSHLSLFRTLLRKAPVLPVAPTPVSQPQAA